jgi:predicted DNA-binding protein
LEKLKALRVLRPLSHTYYDTLQWIENKQEPFLSQTSDISSSNRSTRGANIQTINYYILSLPASFDLFPQELFQQFDRLKAQLNASNATYIREAIFSISQKVTDQYFLKHYIEFIHSEHFSKLGE